MIKKGTWVFNCSKCGKFTSENKGGFADIYYDNYYGCYEQGYPLCANCIKKTQKKVKI